MGLARLLLKTINGISLFGSGDITITGGSGVGYSIPQTVAGTKTLALADKGKFNRHQNATAAVLNVDTNANVAFTAGDEIEGYQEAAGQITVTALTGVTLMGADGAFKTRTQGSPYKLKYMGSDTWAVFGDLSI